MKAAARRGWGSDTYQHMGLATGPDNKCKIPLVVFFQVQCMIS